MREIKFRAWSDGGMYHVNGLACSGESDAMDLVDDSIGGYVQVHNYDDLGSRVLMQYTGLRDKNGVEIYEGDILRITHEDGDSEVYQVRYMADRDYPAFDLVPHLDCDSNGLSHAMAVCEIEIIGNIYENPELLGVNNNA